MGTDQAFPDHGRVCVRVQQTGQTAFRWRALSDPGLLLIAALEVLFQCAFRKRQQPGRQLQFDFQGLLSAIDRTNQCGSCEFCRLYDFGNHSFGADGLVQLRSELADFNVTCIYRDRVCSVDRSWIMAGIFEC